MVHNSTLKRKTPLKAKTSLKTKTALKSKTGIKSNSKLSVNKGFCNKTATEGLSSKKKIYVYKPKYKYESIFTTDLTKCYITGSTKASGAEIHIHHVFGASNKTNSEKYHFLMPLRADWHDLADYGIHFNRELDLKVKRACQEYWLKHYGTKDEFIAIFGKWW